MTDEVTYDHAGSVDVDTGTALEGRDAPPPGDALGCHSGADMKEAARLAGQSEMLDQFAADYPTGPHDKPQSMCPAFGSLRVGRWIFFGSFSLYHLSPLVSYLYVSVWACG